MKHWGYRYKLGLISLASALGLALFGIIARQAIEEVQVNGALYQEIVQQKDLVADILPPPAQLMESYLVTLQMLETSHPADLPPLKSRAEALREDFETRHSFWKAQLTDESLKDALLDNANTPAQTFFSVRESRFIPALEAGRGAEAREILQRELSPAYEAHQKAIASVVTLADKANKALELRAAEAVSHSQRLMVAAGGTLIALILLLAWFIAQNICLGLQFCTQVLDAVSRGDFSQRVQAPTGDEVGRMSQTLNEVLDSIQARVGAILQTVQEAERGQLAVQVSVTGTDPLGQIGEALQRFLRIMADSMRQIAGDAERLNLSAETVSRVSSSLTQNVDATSSQTTALSSASIQVHDSIQSMAAGAEEMTASIREISRSASSAVQVASKAVTMANTTNALVDRLGVSSTQVEQVIKVISTIAQQTNLLALNATIEAARAGESGKGFAVVANEVKELARATASATDDIRHRIEAIRNDSSNAASALHDISDIIHQICTLQTTIASAVEEQTATTQEMARSAVDAAKGADQISGQLQGLSGTANSTAQGAQECQHAAGHMADMSVALSSLLDQFDVGERLEKKRSEKRRPEQKIAQPLRRAA